MDIDKIPFNVLTAVRQNMGGYGSSDTTFDEEIKTFPSKELIARWSEWEIGERYWGTKIIDYYEEMELSK